MNDEGTTKERTDERTNSSAEDVMSWKCDRKTIYDTRPAPWRGTIRKVPAVEGRRWHNERARVQTRQRRDWTHDQVERLADLLDAGLDYMEIAQALRRTPTAIKIKAKRIKRSMRRTPVVLNARQAGQLLGVACSKRIVDWIGRGWLIGRARTTSGTPRTIWAVQYDDLVAFLRDSRYWMTYDPALITDPDLRAELVALRANAPGWLTVGAVARRYIVDIATVKQWIAKGFLPATRYGNHWVWSADLDGWVIPSMRSKVGIPRGAGRRAVGKTHLEAA